MPINPWITNNFVDSCAFDPKYNPEDRAAAEIFRLHKEEGLLIHIAHSTQKEVGHPSTPVWVKKEAGKLIYTLNLSLTPDERVLFRGIHGILTGQGKPENMEQDASHIFEAQKYGSYFITTDEKLLKRAKNIRALCGLEILLPSGFLKIAGSHNRPDR